MPDKPHIVSVSSGFGSAEALRRTIDKVGHDLTVAVFADVGSKFDERGNRILGEDDDNYRFLDDVERVLEHPVIRTHNPKYDDIWDCMFKNRLLGNSQHDPCSKHLKRKWLDRWIRNQGYRPDNCVLVTGLGWQEQARCDRWAAKRAPWQLWFPLCERPYWTRDEMSKFWEDTFAVKRPRMYDLGFSHANCSGFCIKMGHYQAWQLWKTWPDKYEYHAQKEQEFKRTFNYDNTILKDRRNKKTTPISLMELRERFEAGYVPKIKPREGCAGRCAIPV